MPRGPASPSSSPQAGAVVVHAGPGQRPSTAQLLDAIHRARADAVVVLPNDTETLAVAEAAARAAREGGTRVSRRRRPVPRCRASPRRPSTTPSRQVDDDVVRMSAAAGATRDGAVTVAARDAITTAGPCSAGDVLGVVQGDFVVVGTDLAEVAVEVVDRLLSGGGELVTLVTGANADPGLVTAVADHLHRVRREVEVVIHEGGQARYPLLVGVE